MVHKIAKILTFLSFLLVLGCTARNAEQERAATQPYVAPKELRLFTWSEYFDDALIQAFETKTGAKVKADYFSSNEQMLAKLQVLAAGKDPGYDLIIPSDYMVRILIAMNFLSPLDHAKLPFLAEFEKDALNQPYDPGAKYSIPLTFGSTGIAVNTELVKDWKKGGTLSWKDVFENPKYAGKVTLLDDQKEVLQAALLVRGKDLALATEADVKAAFEYLGARKGQVKAFTSETRPAMEAGDCALCMAYSGDALSVSKEKPHFEFVIPKEGGSVWLDNFAIPANSKSPELAYEFMSMVLSAEGAKAFTERTGYRTANKKARTALPKEITDNKIIYPTANDIKRLHYIVERKELTLFIDKEWTKLKSQ